MSKRKRSKLTPKPVKRKRALRSKGGKRHHGVREQKANFHSSVYDPNPA